MMKRLFIGVPIESETVEQAVKSWRTEQLLYGNKLNWVKPESWHITLLFLGDIKESEVTFLELVIEESFRSVHAFSTRLIGTGVFPHQGNPKVLWIGLENLQLLMPAYSHMMEFLRQYGLTFNNKPLYPHLTLARIQSLENSTSFESFLTQNRRSPFRSVTINHVVLYESILKYNGPVYKPLFVYRLKIDQQ